MSLLPMLFRDLIYWIGLGQKMILKDGSMKDFLLTVETAGFNVSQYIEYFISSKLIIRTKKTVKKQLIFLKKIECILKPQPWKKQRNGLKHMI